MTSLADRLDQGTSVGKSEVAMTAVVAVVAVVLTSQKVKVMSRE
jgi:hypothetical protein